VKPGCSLRDLVGLRAATGTFLGDPDEYCRMVRDGIAAGTFGDWRTGISETWREDVGRKLAPIEEQEAPL